ncbi:MAG TPA: hypothetical protein VMX33_12710 [bacterium]|nr:hypothetical protein [bacterium]
MIRIEIIANRSVQDEIVGNLENDIPDILYTIVPIVHGRGGKDRRLGTATWPEENFMLITWVTAQTADQVRQIIVAIKQRFPNEGIKIFSLGDSQE